MVRGLGIILSLLLINIAAVNYGYGKNQSWLDYTEPEGRFALKYPNTWLLGGEFNITSPEGLKFYVDNQHKSQLDEIMQVGIGHRGIALSAPQMNINTTLKLDSTLFIEKFKDDLQNFTLLRQPEFVKYMIDGHKAFNFEFSFVKSNLEKKGLFLATDINGSIFYVLYTADENQFSKTLPTIERIIRSVKIQKI